MTLQGIHKSVHSRRPVLQRQVKVAGQVLPCQRFQHVSLCLLVHLDMHHVQINMSHYFPPVLKYVESAGWLDLGARRAQLQHGAVGSAAIFSYSYAL